MEGGAGLEEVGRERRSRWREGKRREGKKEGGKEGSREGKKGRAHWVHPIHTGR